MTRSPRSAFSLIELLVVIALLAVLAALSAGTFFRIRSSQQVNAAESTLNQINTGLERIMTAKRDQADKEYATGQLIGSTSLNVLNNYSGANQRDRARGVWMFLRIKNEFPQTFSEAILPTTLYSGSASFSPAIKLPAKQTILAAILTPSDLAAYQSSSGSGKATLEATLAGNYAPASNDEANLQAAALLYLILSESGSGGEVFDADVLKNRTAEVAIGNSGKTFRVFRDSWGTPITYIRFTTNGEINDQPIARQPASLFTSSIALPNGKSNNPYDPTRTFRNSLPLAGGVWNNFPGFCYSFGFNNSVSTNEQKACYNFLASAISAGADKNWNSLNVAWGDTTAKPIPSSSISTYYLNPGIVEYPDPTNPTASDNLFGYRLRQFGARSD